MPCHSPNSRIRPPNSPTPRLSTLPVETTKRLSACSICLLPSSFHTQSCHALPLLSSFHSTQSWTTPRTRFSCPPFPFHSRFRHKLDHPYVECAIRPLTFVRYAPPSRRSLADPLPFRTSLNVQRGSGHASPPSRPAWSAPPPPSSHSPFASQSLASPISSSDPIWRPQRRSTPRTPLTPGDLKSQMRHGTPRPHHLTQLPHPHLMAPPKYFGNSPI